MKKRSEIPQNLKWDIESIYASDTLWQKDCNKAADLARQFTKFAGKLVDTKTLLSALQLRDSIWRIWQKTASYAYMRRDEDNTSAKYQAMVAKVQGLGTDISTRMAFFRPELMELLGNNLESLLKAEPGLELYRHELEVALRKKPHILSAAEEAVVAALDDLTDGPSEIFGMINDADMDFGKVKDEDGREVQLTHGNYGRFLENHDRAVRRGAYERVYETYQHQANTLATTYFYDVKGDVATSKLRHYPSALERALSGDNVPISVYTNLVDAVHASLPTLQRYLELKRRALGPSELAMYDVYMPLANSETRSYTYDEAKEIVLDALAPLGEEYVRSARAGLESGWVDVLENAGKTSGAYSGGCYDSKPFILLNFSGRLNDVFTLAHELGHSMHAFYTRRKQPFAYGGHSIFTAEVASTVNELLLMDHLTKQAKPEQKAYLLAQHIDDFRTTLIRQTMFAEFEKLTHERVWQGEALTAEWLCTEYGRLNDRYYGPVVKPDNFIKYEWSRIPHFYRAFYVYKYATGYSAATAISDLVLHHSGAGGYIEFLKSGESDDPIELLKIAGVDMSQPEPVTDALRVFAGLVDQLEELL
ncbi:MAG: oligoendopeptidase F [Candidatus Nomurabacteria bacterium]|jgi:oligoendopeptidase F|nr:oligoendopeptidase F [Candidatus Nomurabacteria bacterium]